MNLNYDIYADSLSKAGELKCGDRTDVERLDDRIVVLLTDGLGSGFTASLHAGMTAQLIISMIKSGSEITEIIKTVVGNMKESPERGINYCAFTILEANFEGELCITTFNTPEPVLLRRGKIYPFEMQTYNEFGQDVKTVQLELKPNDTIVAFSDGVTKAGIGGSLDLGLGRKSTVSYIQAAYKPHISAEKLSKLLINMCNSLYLEKPGDDVSVAVIRTIKSLEQ